MTKITFMLIMSMMFSGGLFSSPQREDFSEETLNLNQQIAYYNSFHDTLKKKNYGELYPLFFPEAQEICQHALCLVKEELTTAEDLEIHASFKAKIQAKADAKKLFLSDLKTLFFQLSFLRDKDLFSHDYIRTLITKNAQESDDESWWQDDRHPFFKSLLDNMGDEMFLLPEKGDSFIKAHLKAFLQVPKVTIFLFPFGQDQSLYPRSAHAINYELSRGGGIGHLNDSNLLAFYTDIVQDLWNPEDPVSTFFLYILSRDYFCPYYPHHETDQEESTHERIFSDWVHRFISNSRQLIFEKPPYLNNFFESLDPLQLEDDPNNLRILIWEVNQKNVEQKWSVQAKVFLEKKECYYPDHYTYTNNSSSPRISALVSFILEATQKSEKQCDLKVIGFENWQEDSFFDEWTTGDEKIFLPFLTPLLNKSFSVSPAKHYRESFYQTYLPLLQILFPEEGFTIGDLTTIDGFILSKIQAFYDASLEKLKKFRAPSKIKRRNSIA